MRHITQISACFINSLKIYQSKLCLEKEFWTQLKTLMRYFQLQLMQISNRRRNCLLLRLIIPIDKRSPKLG